MHYVNEMTFIAEMDYAPYFLTVYDIVRYARNQGILCQGRESFDRFFNM
jgi:error-prone DNA polymerase